MEFNPNCVGRKILGQFQIDDLDATVIHGNVFRPYPGNTTRLLQVTTAAPDGKFASACADHFWSLQSYNHTCFFAGFSAM
jgi:hypothetical protein